MAVTVTGSTITWNDGTTTTTASAWPETTVNAITTTNGSYVGTFAIGSLTLMRTSGGLINFGYGGAFVACMYINNQTGAPFYGDVKLADNTIYASYVTSTFSQDLNNHWYQTTVTVNGSTSTLPTFNQSGTSVTALTGIWVSRGQFFGRGLVAPKHANFCLMQRIS